MGLPENGASLHVQALRLSYSSADGPRSILDIDRFEVQPGELVAICGPSGSGKSSLLNLLSGISKPDMGSIAWSNGLAPTELTVLRPRASDRWRRQHLGIVFQQFHLFPKLSPLENVLIASSFDHWRVPQSVRAYATALLHRIGVPLGHSSDRLSRGEMQRVALARALVLQPRILIADEPTASLDPDTAESTATLLIELCREHGITALVATHDLHLAQRLDTPLMLEHGQLREREFHTGFADNRPPSQPSLSEGRRTAPSPSGTGLG